MLFMRGSQYVSVFPVLRVAQLRTIDPLAWPGCIGPFAFSLCSRNSTPRVPIQTFQVACLLFNIRNELIS